jgi:hypothetical protein
MIHPFFSLVDQDSGWIQRTWTAIVRTTVHFVGCRLQACLVSTLGWMLVKTRVACLFGVRVDMSRSPPSCHWVLHSMLMQLSRRFISWR